MSNEHEKGIVELVDDLGREVRKLNLMLANRCIDCGSHDVLIVRCRACEAVYQAEQRLYRSGP